MTFKVSVGRGRVREVQALRDVSIRMFRGKTIAVVGESGSGKTTLARALSGYYTPTEGVLRLDGEQVSPSQTRSFGYRSRVQLMFQDPFASLNPVHPVAQIVGRVVARHAEKYGGRNNRSVVLDLLTKVRLTPADLFIDKFPHELSGGQRQRVVLARALAVGADVLLADEPISMLDVSVRADMLNLLTQLRDDEGMSMMYVTHDMASARYIADEIAVMYAGRIVETGPADEIVAAPQHPYTRLLVGSAPDPDRVGSVSREERFMNTPIGEPPSLLTRAPGCSFAPRCPLVMERCRSEFPGTTMTSEGHLARCFALDSPVADVDTSTMERKFHE